VLLKGAEDIGHLSLGFWPGRTPADHNPLTDVSGRKPNLKPVTHGDLRSRTRCPALRSTARLPGAPKAGAFWHP
jgi:hypothetical protein